MWVYLGRVACLQTLIDFSPNLHFACNCAVSVEANIGFSQEPCFFSVCFSFGSGLFEGFWGTSCSVFGRRRWCWRIPLLIIWWVRSLSLSVNPRICHPATTSGIYAEWMIYLFGERSRNLSKPKILFTFSYLDRNIPASGSYYSIVESKFCAPGCFAVNLILLMTGRAGASMSCVIFWESILLLHSH